MSNLFGLFQLQKTPHKVIFLQICESWIRIRIEENSWIRIRKLADRIWILPVVVHKVKPSLTSLKTGNFEEKNPDLKPHFLNSNSTVVQVHCLEVHLSEETAEDRLVTVFGHLTASLLSTS